MKWAPSGKGDYVRWSGEKFNGRTVNIVGSGREKKSQKRQVWKVSRESSSNFHRRDVISTTWQARSCVQSLCPLCVDITCTEKKWLELWCHAQQFAGFSLPPCMPMPLLIFWMWGGEPHLASYAGWVITYSSNYDDINKNKYCV